MNDYARGALEALSWVRELLRRVGNLEAARREVEDALEDIMQGVGVDFRHRLRALTS